MLRMFGEGHSVANKIDKGFTFMEPNNLAEYRR